MISQMNSTRLELLDLKHVFEGTTALYWTRSGFSLVTLQKISDSDWGMNLEVRLVATAGLRNTRPPRGACLEIGTTSAAKTI